MKIILTLGTRPQIIKSAPLIWEALKQELNIEVIHTGQHYNCFLSKVFFEELSPLKPIVNLNVGSGSHIYQIAEIMTRFENYIINQKPSLVIVPGDTNSALAAAISSIKLGIPVAHLESGARSYDMSMAEEINRRLIDHCANLLFVPTSNCKKNLEKESVMGDIYQVGDTMYDVFINFKDRAENNNILEKLDLLPNEYVILTTHRAENVDNGEKLKNIFQALTDTRIQIIFPIHPRTKKRLAENCISLNNTNIRLIDPVSYIEMLKLLKHAKMVITDSGGLQKEAFWSKTPCLTIRDRTEWIETIDIGVNFVTDTYPEKIIQKINYIQNNYEELKSRFKTNPYGNGAASEKIIKIIKKNFC